jgi:hypothetical protein
MFYFSIALTNSIEISFKLKLVYSRIFDINLDYLNKLVFTGINILVYDYIVLKIITKSF